MKKIVSVWLVGLFTVAGVVSARVWAVPGDFNTVQEALDTQSGVNAGDEVQVAAGIWNDPARSVIVRDGITVRGQGPENTRFVFNDEDLVTLPVALRNGASFIGIRVSCGAGTMTAFGSGWESIVSNVIIESHNADTGLSFYPEHGTQVDHVTITNARFGIACGGEGPGRIRDCIVKECAVGILALSPVDIDYILYECINPYYYPDRGHGLHDNITGHSNLNTCFVPLPPSDAIGMAEDGGTVGALDFPWESETVDFRLALTGGFQDGRGMMFSYGNTFSLDVVLNHIVCGGINTDIYVVLEAYGQYYFWPGWTQEVIPVSRTVPEDSWSENVLQFVWPEVAGRGQATFWAAGFIPGTVSVETLLTPVVSAPFFWGE